MVWVLQVTSLYRIGPGRRGGGGKKFQFTDPMAENYRIERGKGGGEEGERKSGGGERHGGGRENSSRSWTGSNMALHKQLTSSDKQKPCVTQTDRSSHVLHNDTFVLQ